MIEQASGPDLGWSDPEIHRCSTDEVRCHERLAYWVDAICDSLFSMATTTRDARHFRSELTGASLDGLYIVRATGSQQTSLRSPTMLARGGDQAYHLVSDRAKPWMLLVGGRQVPMRKGDLALLDTSDSFGGAFVDGCEVFNLRLPPAWLRTWVAEPGSLTGKRIEGARGWGKALASATFAVAPERLASSSSPMSRTSDQIGELLAHVEMEARDPVRSPRRESLRRARPLHRILDIVNERLSDPELSIDVVAASLSVDRPCLNRWLADVGTTFAIVLQQERLARASDMLSRRACEHLSVRQIGEQIGLPRDGALSGLMRRHWGRGSAAYRRAALGR